LHQQTGLTVPPMDSAALGTAINQLLDNPDLRASLGRAARSRASQEFSLDSMASRTFSLYEQIVPRSTTDAA